MPKLYELRVFKGQQPVRVANRLLVTLDLADPASVNDLLRRHLLAIAERDGATRRDAHLYHVNVHEVRNERAERDASFQFSTPVEV
ncbi:hypothetical protein [Micromonospora carbonacea]|uniref:Uncharacterized protein n=1 Tax=Micromonospora carbonacea TaxID=47853 RepID=A0A1C5AB66_9ACTN|nr:hypothetical protein [Micromonospora carbonacea]SCF42457.1 hypothetical protein GA0070563_11281 [Micromonospora carbonacea]